MNLFQLFRNIRPFVRPYKWLVMITLILTLLGSAMQQVNAIVLDRTVDSINALIGTDFTWNQAARILVIISVVLLGKEILSELLRRAYAHSRVKRPFTERDREGAHVQDGVLFTVR